MKIIVEHDRNMKNCSLGGPILINHKSERCQLIQNSHKYGKKPKGFHNYQDTAESGTPIATISRQNIKKN